MNRLLMLAFLVSLCALSGGCSILYGIFGRVRPDAMGTFEADWVHLMASTGFIEDGARFVLAHRSGEGEGGVLWAHYFRSNGESRFFVGKSNNPKLSNEEAVAMDAVVQLLRVRAAMLSDISLRGPIAESSDARALKAMIKRPNKSPEPTPTAVTPRAAEGKSK